MIEFFNNIPSGYAWLALFLLLILYFISDCIKDAKIEYLEKELAKYKAVNTINREEE